MIEVIRHIHSNVLIYHDLSRTHIVHIGSYEWQQWLADENIINFYFENHLSNFIACKVKRGDSECWYAYRKWQGKLYETRLGTLEELTYGCLANAAILLVYNPHSKDVHTNIYLNDDLPLPLCMLSGVEEAHADLKVTDHFRPDPFHSPYLNTKLFPPAAPRELVSRPRLLERLEAGKASGLTLISAPAGFGKTTLLNDWITHSGQSVAWVSLDRSDNDTEQFWHYIIMALQTLHADLHEQLSPFLLAIRSVSTNSIITSLINIISTFSRDIVLVLDNYQLITSEQIHHAITFLLEHLPQQLHLIIASRTDPHLPLARLRALGQLSEIRTNDLRFTYHETTTYLGYSKHLAEFSKGFYSPPHTYRGVDCRPTLIRTGTA